MSDLSPAAQAILDAYQFAPIEDHLTAAAVLRAAADQVVPHEYLVGVDVELQARQLTRLRLLAIAAELEQLNEGTKTE
jgi:hypothetical protein